MTPLNWHFTILWGFWFLFFISVEGAAVIRKKPGETLTSHIRAWFALKGKPAGWLFRRMVWFGFLGWLSSHFGGG